MNAAVNDKVIIRVGGHTYSGTILYRRNESLMLTCLVLLDHGQSIGNEFSIKTYLPGKSNLSTTIGGYNKRKIKRILDKTDDPKYIVWIPDWDILSIYDSDLTLNELINQLDEEVL